MSVVDQHCKVVVDPHIDQQSIEGVHGKMRGEARMKRCSREMEEIWVDIDSGPGVSFEILPLSVERSASSDFGKLEKKGDLTVDMEICGLYEYMVMELDTH